MAERRAGQCRDLSAGKRARLAGRWTLVVDISGAGIKMAVQRIEGAANMSRPALSRDTQTATEREPNLLHAVLQSLAAWAHHRSFR
jgi:hypothetical protein